MVILLTDDQKEFIKEENYSPDRGYIIDDLVACIERATLQAVVEWLGEGNRDGEYIYFYMPFSQWQALRREAGLEK